MEGTNPIHSIVNYKTIVCMYDLVDEVRSTYTATEVDPAEKCLGWKVV